jgi:hypothetical protein
MLCEGNQDKILHPFMFFNIGLNEWIKRIYGDKHIYFEGHSVFLQTMDRGRWMLRWGVGVNALKALQSSTDTLGVISSVADLVYTVCDIGSYLQSFAPQVLRYNGSTLGKIACFCWFFNSWLSIYKLLQKLQRLNSERKDRGPTEEIDETRQQIKLLMLNSILAANWASPRGQFMGNYPISLIGFYVGVINFAKHYRKIPE